MSDVVIRAEGVAKQYRLGARQAEYKTLREAVTGAAALPWRTLKSFAKAGNGDVRQTERFIWALQNISLEIKRGEVVGLIGRNGAGKSTLLKILSRITEPTKGFAKITGRIGSLLEVGTGFHPELTGRENIFLNGAILGMRKTEIKRKFDEIVAFAEVERFIDTAVKHYSSGMYLRLAFAVAAHLEPQILLVDEVLAVGDASFQNKCLGKMSDIAGEGRTVLFVSHNMPAVRTLCKRAILLDQGGVEREGEAGSVVQYYLLGEYQDSKRVWRGQERPGNDAIKLNSIRLLDATGAEVPAINISDELVVEIDYEVVERGASVGFALNLFNSEGLELFATLSNTEQGYYGTPMECGNYKTICRLYGNLLNAGQFYFSVVGFSANWSDPFRIDQAVAFDAIDDGLLRGDYYSGFGGSLRPKLLWETTAGG